MANHHGKFFNIINDNQIDILADIRLYKFTQLAGFSKSQDLKYFLKQICNCNYTALQEFAPTQSLFDNYKKSYIEWNEYEKIYNDFLNTHAKLDFFVAFQNKRISLLFTEDTPKCCHRCLLAEKIANMYDSVLITHL